MSNLLQLPGLIDIHVHLRDPGETHKEDFISGTSAALAGGITAVFDMPNNIVPVYSDKVFEEKLSVVSKKAVCDYALYFGSDGKNISEFEKVKYKVIALKIYLNITTGKYLLDNEVLLEKIFYHWPKDKVIVVHAEGDKIDIALKFALKYINKIHITHISLASDLDKIIRSKQSNKNISCDVTPHHLFLTKDDEFKLNNFAKMKPRLSSKEDLNYLWKNLKYIDCICTDHAPHTKSEKLSADTPYGVPGLETMLPLLLTAVLQKKLTIEDIVQKTNQNPQKIFGYIQDKGTYIEVDTENKYSIENNSLKTKCGWSPFNGWEVQGKVNSVYIRKTKVYQDGSILVRNGFGKNIIS